jgi:hypothetical protein
MSSPAMIDEALADPAIHPKHEVQGVGPKRAT